MANLEYEDISFYLENIPGVVVIDMDGMVRYVNEQCSGYFGLKKESILDRHITEVFPKTKMIEGLKQDKPELVFYSSYLGIGITIQVPLFKDKKKVGLLEYDATQNSERLYELSRGYSNFLDNELLNVEKEIIKLSEEKYSIMSIAGGSAKIREMKKDIIAAAKSNSTVLITGETGTGKELVAHAIHNLSGRRNHKMIKINASAFPENLVESELFGYEKGSFTGAAKDGKKGKFELANKGTLFIDEVNQMPMSIQPKLLRVLQEREVDRIGGEEPISVDIRVIAASNEDLGELVKKGLFREDLYYRFHVIEIKIPPLRERKEDIEELVIGKIKTFNITMSMSIEGIEPEAVRLLEQHHWPGNVRELTNVVERAMNFAEGRVLTANDFRMAWSLPVKTTKLADLPSEEEDLIKKVRNDAERELITTVLARFGGNKTKAAEFLKIPRPLLYQKMKRLGI
ncbi:MAG: sigma 54-interacting transcriptional regulator [Anaerovoracaceae bacterium]